MKLVEFTNPEENRFDFDIIDDACVFMRNDPIFYRKHYYPVMAKLADNVRDGKKPNKIKLLAGMVETGINEYCKRYDLGRSSDEVFNQTDREALIDKIFSEECSQIDNGDYK